MSRKINTLMFLLAATLFNVAAGTASFAALYLLYNRYAAPWLEDSAQAWSIPVMLILAAGISFAAYFSALRLFTRKVNIERHFSPLFTPEHRKR